MLTPKLVTLNPPPLPKPISEYPWLRHPMRAPGEPMIKEMPEVRVALEPGNPHELATVLNTPSSLMVDSPSGILKINKQKLQGAVYETLGDMARKTPTCTLNPSQVGEVFLDHLQDKRPGMVAIIRPERKPENINSNLTSSFELTPGAIPNLCEQVKAVMHKPKRQKPEAAQERMNAIYHAFPTRAQSYEAFAKNMPLPTSQEELSAWLQKTTPPRILAQDAAGNDSHTIATGSLPNTRTKQATRNV